MNQTSVDDMSRRESRLGLNGRLVLQHKKPVVVPIIITSPSSNIIMILYGHCIGCSIFTISLPKYTRTYYNYHMYIYKYRTILYV